MAQSITECVNCMIAMQQFPDKFFDLAIVDPPYGIGEDGKKNHSRGKKAVTLSGKRSYSQAKAHVTLYTPK